MMSEGKFNEMKKLVKQSESIDEAKASLVEIQRITEKLRAILSGFEEFDEYMHDLVETQTDLFEMAKIKDAQIRAELSELFK